MNKGYKRRKFFINKELQGKLILSCLLFITGCGVLFNVLLGILSLESLSVVQTSNHLQSGHSVVPLLKQVMSSNWFLIIVGGGCMLVAILLLSHRIAGPLYRFETTLDRMQKGQLNCNIQLRDKDEGKELARKINEFNQQLGSCFRNIHQNSEALETLIEKASALDLPEEEKEQLASLCWSMREHNRKISTCSSYFNQKSG